jgi:predicted solute-binding protein
LGVIIHENRFTLPTERLHKVIDLGEYWETENETAEFRLVALQLKETVIS